MTFAWIYKGPILQIALLYLRKRRKNSADVAEQEAHLMVSDQTVLLDEAAMERILARAPIHPEGAILRLAWQEGLSRKELTS